MDPEGRGPDLDAIWDGGPQRRTALLTVFRHDDNATVAPGLIGEVPQTAWVIDYPILERIYYDLVAGFDVFGPVGHQLETRLYMDLLRMEAEDLFLEFLPPGSRAPLRDSWYQGAHARIHQAVSDRGLDTKRGTRIAFESKEPEAEKAELLLQIAARAHVRDGRADPLGRCGTAACRAQLDPVLRELATLSGRTGAWVRHLPEASLLRVGAGDEARTFTLVHDRAHLNVAFLFDEESRRQPELDTLTILPGLLGSYPNFFFEVAADRLGDFAAKLLAIDDDADWLRFVAEFGIRRSSPRFWPSADAHHAALLAMDPIEAGILDLNRYVDP